MRPAQAFDYIVVGAGSTGCVMVNRLSESPDASVLLLEAGGPDTNPNIHDPSGLLKLFGTDIDWKYVTEEQPHLNGRRIMISRGKVLGGCSSIHAMVYIRGNRRDFDHWNFLGNEGWSYRDALPQFKKSEDYEGGASEFHGAGGPLSVVKCPAPTPVAHAFVNAAVEMGYGGPDWDFNGAQQEGGAGLYQLNVTKGGRRCSAATAFLTPILNRPNLTVKTGAQVTRLLFEGNRAVGLQYTQDGRAEQVRADREVVLCGGAFDSPKLLLLSGIGPADRLRAHGIPAIVDVRGVGRNLQDHVLLPVVYRSKRDFPVPTFLAEAGLFTRTRQGMGAAPPDLQFHFSGGVPALIPTGHSVEGSTFFFVAVLVRPQSRGWVDIRSASPNEPPIIQPNYLQCDTDLQVLLEGIRLARDLARTRAFAEFNGGEVAPGTNGGVPQLYEYVRAHASTVWHPVGTCKMGRDTDAVVDPQLRVYGVEGLRVADASIMPTVTTGNPNAACIMIGEMAAKMIRADSSGRDTGRAEGAARGAA